RFITSILKLWMSPSSILFPYTTLVRSSAFDDLSVLIAVTLGDAQVTAAFHDQQLHIVRSKAIAVQDALRNDQLVILAKGQIIPRSEEHTSEPQSRENLVCRHLLEKKK